MEEGQVKAEDLLVVLRTMSSSGKGKPSLMERAVGGVFFCLLISCLLVFAEGDKKVKYLVVEGPEALQKLGNRDEVWYDSLYFFPFFCIFPFFVFSFVAD